MKAKPDYKNIDEYISAQPEEMRSGLKRLRKIIKAAAPKSQEVISYQMPGFKQTEVLVWFAAAKNHFGLYPKTEVIKIFKDKLKAYETSTGTIRFPKDEPLPEKLITQIVKFRLKQAEEKAKKKTLKKR
jgi:uncharacterized protein YdhG (YjbR/CyaY superfamily)